ncbi:MAG: MOSC N-terminal beta barrel domain-containing protein [Bacteroidota bacterium]
MQDYKLSDIYIYPIKSLGSIRVKNIKTTEKGLEFDRRWMLINQDRQFLTIRRYPEFLFFKMSLLNSGFRIRYQEKILDVPIKIDEGEKVRCEIWNDEVEAIKASDRINQWFSTILGIDCSLVYMPEETKRNIKPLWGGTSVSFADGYPLLIASEASLSNLNSKLKNPVGMIRFRPNLVFKGVDPYDEFNWSKFKINSTQFQGLKPCERCIVTTFDPKTGEKGREPLLTLSKQKINNKIVFGQHAKSVDQGTIGVGDVVKVLSYKSNPYDSISDVSV